MSNYDLFRTNVCVNCKIGCTKQGCTFAHNENEILPKMCRFGDECFNEYCTCYHSWNEIPTGSELFEYASVGVKFKELRTELRSDFEIVRTRVCNYYKIGCTKKDCTFAHNENEILPKMCRFGNECFNENCIGYHNGDVIPNGSELFRLATEGLKFVELKQNKSKIQNKSEEKFIIEIENQDENVQDNEVKQEIQDNEYDGKDEENSLVYQENLIDQDLQKLENE